MTPLTAAICAWSGPAGVKRAPGLAVVEEMSLVRQRGVDFAREEHRPEMRAVHLVEREVIGVDAELREVRQPVRREGDAVHEGPGAGPVHEVGELAHRVDAADDVRAVRERDELRARAEQGLEVAALELGGRGIRPSIRAR